MGKVICRNCKWWDNEEEESEDEFFYGKCRRRAPCLTLGMVVERGLDDALLAEFPRTESTLDWCGEFKLKSRFRLIAYYARKGWSEAKSKGR